MQLSAYPGIEYYHDGRDKFKVIAGDEEKHFTTTDTITVDRALLFAVTWYFNKVGANKTADQITSDTRYQATLATLGSTEVKITKVAKKKTVPVKPAPEKKEKKYVAPRDKTSPPPKPKVVKSPPKPKEKRIRTTPPRNQLRGRGLGEAPRVDRRRPGLPVGVTVHVCHRDGVPNSVQFKVSLIINGKSTVRSFHAGSPGSMTLEEYSIARQVAVLYREHYVRSRMNGVEPDFSDFKQWRSRVYDGTFPFPIRRRKTAVVGKVEMLKSKIDVLTERLTTYISTYTGDTVDIRELSNDLRERIEEVFYD